MKEKIIIVFRWIAFVPASCIAYAVFFFLFMYCQRFYSDDDSWNMLYLAPLISSLIAGIASLLGGVWVAPVNNRRLAAQILILLFTLLAGASIFLYAMSKEYFKLLTIVFSLIGNILGYFSSKDDELINDLGKS